MKHSPYYHRVAQVLATVAVAFAIFVAAPMAEAFRTEVTSKPGAVARVPLGSPAEGDLIARLSLPRLAVDAPVYEGIAIDELARGAGHLPGTAIPGEEGGTNHCVIAIPRDGSAASISRARIGDTVTLRTPFGVRSYRVARARILSPEEVDVGPTHKPRITVVTPYPADAIGPAPLRLALVLERT